MDNFKIEVILSKTYGCRKIVELEQIVHASFSTLHRYYFMKGALMGKETEKQTPKYNGIPKQVSRKDSNRYILPHLSKRIKGPKPKLSLIRTQETI